MFPGNVIVQVGIELLMTTPQIVRILLVLSADVDHCFPLVLFDPSIPCDLYLHMSLFIMLLRAPVIHVSMFWRIFIIRSKGTDTSIIYSGLIKVRFVVTALALLKVEGVLEAWKPVIKSLIHLGIFHINGVSFAQLLPPSVVNVPLE